MTVVPTAKIRAWLVRTQLPATGLTAFVALAVALAAGLAAGWPQARSALVGAGLVVLFFALGALLDGWGAKDAQALGFVVVIVSFGLRLALLTMAVSWLAPLLTSAVWFGIGTSAATLAWVIGLVLGHVTGRWPIYDLAVTPEAAK